MKTTIFLTALAFFVSGCSGSAVHKKTQQGFKSIPSARVIVLPFENQTVDLTGHTMLREMIFDKFAKSGYNPVPMDEVDGKLKKKGLTDGGQLSFVAKDTLKEIFGPQILCYGTVENFTFQNLGFIVRKQVSLKIKMVFLGTGETVFEGAGKGSKTKFYLSKEEAKKAFVRQMAVKLVQNMIKSPLRKEARQAVKKIFKKIPKK